MINVCMGMVTSNSISEDELEFVHESCVHEPNNIYYSMIMKFWGLKHQEVLFCELKG